MKRIASAVLTILMLLAALTACNTAKKETDPGEKDPDRKAYAAALAEGTDYDGLTFTYLCEQEINAPTAEEETGDIISDALFYRQKDLENLFGIDWKNVLSDRDTAAEAVINEVMAGGGSYDLVSGRIRSVGAPALNAGTLRNVRDLKNIDLDGDLWDHNATAAYSLPGGLYLLVGPAVTNYYLDAHCILFNRSTAREYGIDEDALYSSVNDGKWTVDRMFEVASSVPENSDGSGTFRYADPGGRALLFAAGYTITRFDENSMPYVEEQLPDDWAELSRKIVPTFTDSKQSAYADPNMKEMFDGKYGMSEEKLFENGRALFLFTTTGEVGQMRSKDADFGILPVPKLEESRDGYCSLSESYGMWGNGALYVPKTVRDPDMTGTVTEAMASLSREYLENAYYEKLLRGSKATDDKSRETLGTILSGKAYDMIDLYGEGNVDETGLLVGIIDRGFRYDDPDFGEKYGTAAKILNVNIKMLLQQID